MPITKSAVKALKQSTVKRGRNLIKKNRYKNLLKQMDKLVKDGNKNDAIKLIPATYKALDKAVKTNVIKKNKAARLKSKVTRIVK
jgi:small subunit ribosomal protein S20